MISEKEAVELLRKHADSEESFQRVLAHARAVQRIAVRIARRVKGVDMGVIKIGSLLHDIGRFRCCPGKYSFKHGLIGAEMLRGEGLDKFADIAERHLGAGITKMDVKEQCMGLPERDFVPVTKEEKIITHADNLVKGDKEIGIKEAVERYRKEIGDETAGRVRKLWKDVERMMSQTI
ncbi:HDIG domain-containing protein [Candidatus Woesearchaeota archaeon]|nr:HDIG domain-containing protein [Candidatus Woesearchaeota archaeon]